MNKLSVVIITLNAENSLQRVLEQAQKISDNIIIIDSNSTDQTKSIALAYDAQFYTQDWLGYGAQKNFGNDKAKYDWILSLDADEVLSEELVKEINESSLLDRAVYQLPFINHYCGKVIRFGRWKNESHIRIFQRAYVAWNENAVHEGLSIQEAKLIKLKNPVVHYSMSSKEEHLQKAKKYAKLGAVRMYAQGKKSSFIKQYLNPVFRFVMDYMVSLGFLDGRLGLQIAIITAKETYWKYQQLARMY